MKIFNTHSGKKEDFIPIDPSILKSMPVAQLSITMLILEMQEWQLFLIL